MGKALTEALAGPKVHPIWPEERLRVLEDTAKMFGHVEVIFCNRSWEETPSIHVDWRTNCRKCGRTDKGHYLGCKCPEPDFDTKLVYHYQADGEQTAYVVQRYVILDILKDWQAEWGER